MSDEGFSVEKLLKSKWSLVSPLSVKEVNFIVGSLEDISKVQGPTVTIEDNSTRPSPVAYGASQKYEYRQILVLGVWTARRNENDSPKVAKLERDDLRDEIKRIITTFPTSASGIKFLESGFRWQNRDRVFLSPPAYGEEVFVDAISYG